MLLYQYLKLLGFIFRITRRKANESIVEHPVDHLRRTDQLALISLNPFGKEVQYEGGAVSFLLNVVWFLLSGLLLALENFVFGCILCITIIGIPFGKQFFKIAGLSLRPFGATVVREHIF